MQTKYNNIKLVQIGLIIGQYFPACEDNEYIPECIPCPPINCGDKNETACIAVCNPNKKCYCKPGFLRNKEGVCVKPEECGKLLNNRYLFFYSAVINNFILFLLIYPCCRQHIIQRRPSIFVRRVT